MVLPSEACEKLDLGVGDTVIVEVKDGDIRLRSWKKVLKEMQAHLAKKVPPGVSMVDELIAERRAEATRE